MTKKIGCRKSEEDLEAETTAELAKKAKSLIRTDWGGKNPDDVIRRQMADLGVDAGPKSVAAIRVVAERQVEGCRKRTERRLDKIIGRSEADASGREKMP